MPGAHGHARKAQARAPARAPARKALSSSSSKRKLPQLQQEQKQQQEEEEEAAAEAAEAEVAVAEDAVSSQRIRVEVNRILGLAPKNLFAYGAKAFKACPKNEASIKQIAEGVSQVEFVPDGMAEPMTMTVTGKPISFAKGTIWVPANPAQRFDVCQNQVQAEPLCGIGELTSTFYCGNLSQPCPHGIPFIPTAFTLTASDDQKSVWAATDGPASKKLTREQALKQRLNKLPKVLGSGGTETLAKVTAVSGRWLEIQTAGNLRSEQAGVPNGWAHAFLERGPWRGNLRLDSTLSKVYDVVLSVEQHYVPDGSNGDTGFWVLADVTGSVKKADLVGIWLTVAFLPSMGLPKLPLRLSAPPKDVVAALGSAASPSPQGASSPSSEKDQTKESGGYWEVQSGAKRSRVQAKAEMSTGKTML